MQKIKVEKFITTTDRKFKRLILLLFDAGIVFLSLVLAMLLRLETFVFLSQPDVYVLFSITIFPTLYAFFIIGLYNHFLRYFSSEITLKIAFSCSFSALILFFCKYTFGLYLPRSVPFIYLIILFILLISFRYFLRSFYRIFVGQKRKNIAVYGAGEAGSQLIQSMISSKDYFVKMVIDDNIHIQGQRIFGLRIVSFLEAKKNFKKMGINIVLLAIPSANFSQRKKIIARLNNFALIVKTVPGISNLIDGSIEISELKNVAIEDILGREPVQPDYKLMAYNISNKTVLVTGAGGSIGKELSKQIILQKPKKLLLLDISESAIFQTMQIIEKKSLELDIDIHLLIGSIQDKSFLEIIFSKFRVDTIYHSAAYKHVPLMEKNVIQALKNNVLGTYYISKESIKAGVTNFTLISTDKAVNPTNIMGASKRLAECICSTLNASQNSTCFSIVRFGNVLGSSGSVVPLFRKQIEEGGPITLTHPKVTRYFMTIQESVQLVIQASSLAKGGEIFVLDMGQPIKIKDLACKMVQLSGLSAYFEDDPNKGDILIKITGMRPGEKMYEELFHGENFYGTEHPRIIRVTEKNMTLEQMDKLILNIKNCVEKNDYKFLIKQLFIYANYKNDQNQINDTIVKEGDIKNKKIIPITSKN